MPADETAEQFTPHAIRFHQFRTVRRNGFDPDEVATFLYDMAEEISRRDDREAALRAVADRLEEENERLQQAGVEGDPLAMPVVRPPSQSEADVAIVSDAQRQADQIITRAETEALAIVADARQRAAGIYASAMNTAGDKIMRMIGLTKSDMASDISERAEKLRLAEQTLGKAKGEFLKDLNQVVVAARDAQSVLGFPNGQDDTDMLPVPS